MVKVYPSTASAVAYVRVSTEEQARGGVSLVVLYVGADGGQDARVLWPTSITLTADNNLTCKAYCTMRRAWKSFRIDRMLTCHPLTTPDDLTTD
jgi:predicted DNA-binding transcriptional regulator YafY